MSALLSHLVTVFAFVLVYCIGHYNGQASALRRVRRALLRGESP